MKIRFKGFTDVANYERGQLQYIAEYSTSVGRSPHVRVSPIDDFDKAQKYASNGYEEVKPKANLSRFFKGQVQSTLLSNEG